MKNNFTYQLILKSIFCLTFLFLLNQNVFPQSFAIELGGQEISMLNANRTVIVNTGNNGYNAGSVHRYDNLITANGITVYGILRVLETNNARIRDGYFDDDSGNGDAKRFQPRIYTLSSAGGYVLFELEFYELITNSNVYISDYFLTGVDVDGNNSSEREFYEIGGYSSYLVDASTQLIIGTSPVNSSLTRFTGISTNLNNIVFENTAAFIARYPHPDTKITFAMGFTGLVSQSNARQYSAQFGSLGGTFSSVATSYNPVPALNIQKSALPAIFAPGTNSQYTIKVTNAANTASNVTLSDVLPSGLSYIANSTSVSIPASTTTKALVDNFNAVNYNNQNGSASWSSSWYEKNDDTYANSGNIYISTGRLTFNEVDALDEIARNMNLAGIESATLSFDWTTSGLGSEVLTIELSSNGTDPSPVFTALQSFSGSSSGTYTYTVPSSYFTPNATIRFRSSTGNWGSNDVATIDNLQVSYTYSKPNINLSNAAGTLSNGVPPNLVTSADAITLEPNVTMTVTFNVAVNCSASGTLTNTATANCNGLAEPVTATHVATLGPVSEGASFCSPGSVSLTASGAGSGQVYRWYSSLSGGSLLYTGNPFSTPVISNTTTYYVSLYSSGNGCETVRVPVTATYSNLLGTGVISELTARNGLPAGTNYSDVQSSVGFSVSGITGATSYIWSIDYPAASFIGSSTGSTIYVNFNNGGAQSTVNVCVRPVNDCGLGNSICKTIGISDGVNREISGYVFHDSNGSVAPNKVDGIGINAIGGNPLYAILVEAGLTVTSQVISDDGSYKFSYLKPDAGVYSVWISNVIYGTGTTPSSTLPLGGAFNGEINNNSSNSLTGNDGFTNGRVTGLTAGSETNVNFGIALTNPTANNDNFSTNEDATISSSLIVNDVPYSGRTINSASVDLDPTLPGRQTTFSSPGQGVFVVDDLGVITFTPLGDFFGTVTASYTFNDNLGVSSNIAAITVVVNSVNDAPTFLKGLDQTICLGSGPQTISPWATALSTGPSNESLQTFSYNIASNSNTNIFIVQPYINSSGVLTFTPSTTISGTADIQVNIQDNGGVDNGGVDKSLNQTFKINVLAIPTVTPGGPNNACLSSSPTAIILSGASVGGSATTGAWSITSGGGSLSSTEQTSTPDAVTYTPAPNYTGVVTLTLTSNTAGVCSAAIGTRTITVNALPTVTSASVSPASVCGSGQVVFTATASSGTIKWYTAATGGTEVTVLNPTINTTTTYYAEATSAQGCVSASRTAVTATVNALPTVTSASVSPASVCGSGQVVFSATASSGTIKWYTAATGGTEVTVLNPTINATTTYYAEATSAQGCVSASRTAVTATVNALPTVTSASVSPASVCGSGQVVFSATASSGTIKWYTAATGGTEVTVLNPTINTTTT
ncbi:MAG: DUF11 domain-containing protein, partial [Prolixibacteraceae bacterium]|nr:DUF11 domain-containing protein [Prolixibacteraceae bacterium]